MDSDTSPSTWLDIRAATVLRNGRRLLDNLTLAMDRGQHTAILGPNGSGKSTLVKLIERRVYPLAANPDGGPRPQVHLFGHARWHISELKHRIGVVSAALQDDVAADRITVFDAVASSFFASRGPGPDDHVTATQREHSLAVLAQLGIRHLADRVVATLSTGEARRVLIARALVHAPAALLLDEPCAGLDMASRRRFLIDLGRLAEAGTTLVMVTHHIEEILPQIQRVVMLHHGRMLADGTKAALMNDARLSTLFDTQVTVAASDGWYSAHLR
ncbi:MAG TPA: ATP-binding cassette domain-containing protein [Rhodanobacteraceae bacterium]